MGDWFDTPESSTKETTVLLVAACLNEVGQATDKLEALVQDSQHTP